MNDSDDESRFKSKHQNKRRASKKINFYAKEQSDNERNESATNEERSEKLFIVGIQETKAEVDYEGEIRSELKEIKMLEKKEA